MNDLSYSASLLTWLFIILILAFYMNQEISKITSIVQRFYTCICIFIFTLFDSFFKNNSFLSTKIPNFFLLLYKFQVYISIHFKLYPRLLRRLFLVVLRFLCDVSRKNQFEYIFGHFHISGNLINILNISTLNITSQ